MSQYQVEYVDAYETRVTCDGYPGLIGSGHDIAEGMRNLNELIRAIEESPYD